MRGGSASENASAIREILAGETGPKRDIVVANTAAALVAAEIAVSFLEGARMASEAIDSAAASAKLEALVRYTRVKM